MPDVVRVVIENGADDVHGQHIAREVLPEFGEIVPPTTASVYYFEGAEPEQVAAFAHAVLANPVTQTVIVGPRDDWGNPRAYEITDRRKMINPTLETIRKAGKRQGFDLGNMAVGTEVRFDPSTPPEVAKGIIDGFLLNKEVQEIRRAMPTTLEVKSEKQPGRKFNLGDMSDDELVALNEAEKFGLSLVKMKAAQAEVNRKSGGVVHEAGLRILGTWLSDHCRHETFNADLIVNGKVERSLFGRIKDRAKEFYDEQDVLQAFKGNSAAFKMFKDKNGKEWAINIKGETHNHPTLIEAEDGIATGLGGLLRDIIFTGKGAKPIASLISLGIDKLNRTKEEIPARLQTPLQIFKRCVTAISKYGNRMGVGTMDAMFHHHRGYGGKPMFLGVSIGLLEADKALDESPQAGDILFAIGGRTGQDGVGGAVGSSAASNTETLADTSEVQQSNAYEEKKMLDAFLEAAKLGYVRAATDCGAGGVGLAAGELGEGVGVTWDADLLPLKAADFDDAFKVISESQERAVVAVPAEFAEAFEALFAKHDSEATAIGHFGHGGDTPCYTITAGGEVISEWEYGFIENAVPPLQYEAEYIPPVIEESPVQVDHCGMALHAVLAHDDICSTEPAMRQFDHEVQGMNVLKPFTGVHLDSPNYASVLAPFLDEDFGVVFTQSAHPAVTDLDPVKGTAWVVDDLFNRVVAVGGDPSKVKVNNNYITPRANSQVMGTLLLSVDTLLNKLAKLKTSVFTGKDSCSGEHKDDVTGKVIKNPYNLTLAGITTVDDVRNTTSADIKRTDSTLVFIGRQDLGSMGGSILHDVFEGSSAHVPATDYGMDDLDFFTRVHKVVQPQNVLSCGVVGKGGLGATVSKMVFGGDCGVDMRFDDDARLENVLFNETPGLVVEVPAGTDIAKLMGELPHKVIGKTTPHKFVTAHHATTGQTFSESTDDLKESWKKLHWEALARQEAMV